MPLRSAKELLGYELMTLDGQAGYVYDLYFDNKVWVVRYLVIDLGELAPGRRVLLSPETLGQLEWEAEWLPVNLTLAQLDQQPELKARDRDLRSLVEVLGYPIQATDGESGHLEDFVLDDRFWTIRHVVVETQHSYPRKQVSLIPQWIKAMGCREAKIQVNLSRQTIESCPSYMSSFYTRQSYSGRLLHLNSSQPYLTFIPAPQNSEVVYSR